MLQSLRNRRNRKGFTLAELLIVVAIIAVLVAIAVPLFVGALDESEKRVFESNARSLKGMAVSGLLTDKDFKADDIESGIKVKGTVDKAGNLKITTWNVADEVTTWDKYKEATWSGEGDAATKDIVVEVTKATIADYTAPTE